MWQS